MVCGHWVTLILAVCVTGEEASGICCLSVTVTAVGVWYGREVRLSGHLIAARRFAGCSFFFFFQAEDGIRDADM